MRQKIECINCHQSSNVMIIYPTGLICGDCLLSAFEHIKHMNFKPRTMPKEDTPLLSQRDWRIYYELKKEWAC